MRTTLAFTLLLHLVKHRMMTMTMVRTPSLLGAHCKHEQKHHTFASMCPGLSVGVL